MKLLSSYFLIVETIASPSKNILQQSLIWEVNAYFFAFINYL